MFERFTERSRHVVQLAQEAAREFGHGFIGTEHILLGLLRETEGIGARVLETLGLEVNAVIEAIDRIAGHGDGSPDGVIPFTPRAKKSLELSLREALSLGHNYIGTEHVLLGLARENEGVAARILTDAGVGSEAVRNEVIRFLTTPRKRNPAPPAPVAQDLLYPGDLMQSSLSRLAEWVKTQDAPYEVHMAALEAGDGIEAWTDVRRRMR